MIRLCRFRFIPACAGNRMSPVPGAKWSSVHPRVCGEQLRPIPQKILSRGSSPRVQGTVRAFFLPDFIVRFIPACAGNRIYHVYAVPRQPVHPRVCGEQDIPTGDYTYRGGSSPRVRGTGANDGPSLGQFAVHPRVCGEQPPEQGQIKGKIGSSPRVRGTVPPARFRCTYRRFIPACAGNRRECSTRRP